MVKPVKMVCLEERFPAKITNMFPLSIPVLALHMRGEVSLVLKPGRADLTERNLSIKVTERNLSIKVTVSLISSDPPFENSNTRFTTVILNALSH